MKPKQEITIHRDYTVSYFSIYQQVWQRISLISLTERHDDFASLTQADREKVNAALRRQLA